MGLSARIPREVVKVPPREPGRKNTAYRALMKECPCVVCGRPASEGHHLKGGLDPRERGMARKAHDRFQLPVCRPHHETLEAENHRDEEWLVARGIAAREVAAALYRYRNDLPAMLRVVERSLMERGKLLG